MRDTSILSQTRGSLQKVTEAQKRQHHRRHVSVAPQPIGGLSGLAKLKKHSPSEGNDWGRGRGRGRGKGEGGRGKGEGGRGKGEGEGKGGAESLPKKRKAERGRAKRPQPTRAPCASS